MDDDLVTWVLRNARKQAHDPTHRRQSWLAKGNGLHPKVHPAQVGRWETGKIRLTIPLVRRYEDLLGYPAGTLLCTSDLLHRRRQLIRAEPSIRDGDGHADFSAVQELLERAVSTDRMTGMDWYRLSGMLGRNATAVLLERDWRSLFARCTQEMAVSLDLEFALRDESMARLAGHPRSGRIVSRMAAETLSDPSAQVYNDTVSLLMFTDHPDGHRVLMEQLGAPTNNDALRAALIVLAAVVRTARDDTTATHGVQRISAKDLRDIAGASLDFVRDDARPLMVRRQAANVLRSLALPTAQRHRLAARLSADDLRYAATILMEGRAVEKQALNSLGSKIRGALLDVRQSDGHLDPILESVVRTAIEDSDDVARSHSLGVLMLLPQRRIVATVLARELSGHGPDDEVARQEILDVLMWLAVPELLDPVVAMLVNPETKPETVLACGIVLGNAADRDAARSDSRRALIFQRASALVEGTSTVGLGTAEHIRLALRGLVYALGMAGRLDLVDLLRTRTDVHPRPEVRVLSAGICDWWLSMPPHMRPMPQA